VLFFGSRGSQCFTKGQPEINFFSLLNLAGYGVVLVAEKSGSRAAALHITSPVPNIMWDSVG
jgi:hypothetical protein